MREKLLLDCQSFVEELKTPEPGQKHNYCHICRRHFDDGLYKEHIRGANHAQSVSADEFIYAEVDFLIGEMNSALSQERKQLKVVKDKKNMLTRQASLYESSTFESSLNSHMPMVGLAAAGGHQD
mmetsp:Transcript_3064/g.4132  ORF Transcript_3064/g.4132 Transcript_3064/m.4132 type:complete len:125 (+) Transcript_3064:815-1189(+)|eukprot:CAMPEP_0170472214 /NCGR_PEP_ID=MMETSP0123-20130129/14282_1 /TAXON_ID=182087 /ORGANISM="Favella ehrenbergii, Strain Fehren 1" /LENGTH=124 /DNA_ID=CAMNT_0010740335 /DNA_START=920 /DNA_END=1294 /DNA_ORIENTATION=-